VLEELTLSGNFFGDDGAEILARRLRTNSTLERLNLLNCDITERGKKRLADTVERTIKVDY
jgi:Ran GTPase-activating protein (RanGAP) involved in mRNA processing and transport